MDCMLARKTCASPGNCDNVNDSLFSLFIVDLHALLKAAITVPPCKAANTWFIYYLSSASRREGREHNFFSSTDAATKAISRRFCYVTIHCILTWTAYSISCTETYEAYSQRSFAHRLNDYGRWWCIQDKVLTLSRGLNLADRIFISSAGLISYLQLLTRPTTACSNSMVMACRLQHRWLARQWCKRYQMDTTVPCLLTA